MASVEVSAPASSPELNEREAKDLHKCAYCQKDATQFCTGRSGLNEFDATISKTWYCNADCQATHWKTHKPTCKDYQERIKIYRAGKVLQRVFWKFREHAFDIPVKKCKKNGIELVLIQGHRDDERPICPLPKDRNLTAEDRHAIMTYSFCGEALGFMFNVAKELLDGESISIGKILLSNPIFKGLYSTIQEILFLPKNIKCKVAYRDEFGKRDNSTMMGHEVLRLSRKKGPAYVLDISGAQFGYHETIMPWEQYQKERVVKIVKVCRFGHNHDLPKDNLKKYFRPNMAYTEANMHLVKQFYLSLRANVLDAAITAWQKTEKLPITQLLKEPKHDFYIHMEALLKHIDQSLKKFNAHEKKAPVTRFYGGGNGQQDLSKFSLSDIRRDMELRQAMCLDMGMAPNSDQLLAAFK